MNHLVIEIPEWRRNHLFVLSMWYESAPHRVKVWSVMDCATEFLRIPYVGDEQPHYEIQWIEA